MCKRRREGMAPDCRSGSPWGIERSIRSACTTLLRQRPFDCSLFLLNLGIGFLVESGFYCSRNFMSGDRFLLQGGLDFAFCWHGSPRVQSSTFAIEREKSAEISLTTQENGSTVRIAGW